MAWLWYVVVVNAVEQLSPGGPISAQLDHYETRPQQIEMAEAVSRAFADQTHLIVEAGTGVGKSFAYLLPAIERAVDHDECVVISTRTIALQEQLMQKDIPFLQAVLPYEVSAILVKGRNNYVGLRRLAIASRRQLRLFAGDQQRDELWRIEDWALQSGDGSLTDLNPQPPPSVWERVRSDRDNCHGRRCSSYEKCFFQRARRRAAKARILVVNHALFFSDLALRRQGTSLLPRYRFVVLDEAHTIERVAADHLGLTFSDTAIHFLLNALHNERSQRGVLVGSGAQSAIQAVGDARRVVDTFFAELTHWQQRFGRSNGRLTEQPDVVNTVTPALKGLGVSLRGLRAETDDEDDRDELASQIKRAEALAGEFDAVLTQSHDGWVYWLESRPGRRARTMLHGRPIDVSDELKTSLFDETASVVLTSATLATRSDGGFDYLRKRIGLQDGVELQLGSPFDYESQMKVEVEGDMPPPGDADRFIPAACDAIERHLRASDGRALVLFTSYSMLNTCAEQLASFFESEAMPLLVHGGETSRSALLDAFRTDVRSVLFGTDSFWEGVDVIGEALSLVIIVKLPFAVPNRPDTEARIEHIRSAGEDPFRSFQLPEAILKFKQGVGRLIRSGRDRGKVVVLDSRIVQKSYGKKFLRTFPHSEFVILDS